MLFTYLSLESMLHSTSNLGEDLVRIFDDTCLQAQGSDDVVLAGVRVYRW